METSPDIRVDTLWTCHAGNLAMFQGATISFGSAADGGFGLAHTDSATGYLMPAMITAGQTWAETLSVQTHATVGGNHPGELTQQNDAKIGCTGAGNEAITVAAGSFQATKVTCVWDMVTEAIHPDCKNAEIHRDVLIKWHQTKKRVTSGLEELHYNTAIAAMMELVNTLREQNCIELRVVSELVQMVAPLAPHFAEECWERLGHKTSVFDSTWPAFDDALTVTDEITVVVQVNGKVRGSMTVPRGSDEASVRARAAVDENVRRHLEGKTVRKVIYVPGRLVNYVVA